MQSAWPQPVRESARELRGRLHVQIDDFIRDQQLPESFHLLIDNYYLPLAVWLAGLRRGGRTLVIGICGGQGSGKSTLTNFLQMVWAEMDLNSAGFSLDDIYLTRAERQKLGQSVHPLLETRGVPGTHDVQLGLDTIDALCSAGASDDIALPLFDKSLDDRAPHRRWPRRRGPVDLLLFEGWCVGARPWVKNPSGKGGEPINALERNEDPDGSWRNYVREQLAGPYRALFARLDVLLMLKVPDMACVLEWRRLQERKLRARSGGGMDDTALERFVQHYERLTRYLLEEMPGRADCVFELGRDHGIRAMRLKRG